MRSVRVVLVGLCLSLAVLAGCAGSDEAPGGVSEQDGQPRSFSGVTKQDRAGLAEIGRTMAGFAHEYARFARHVKRNNLTQGTRALDRMAGALDRAKRVPIDSREARHAVEEYLDSMRRLVTTYGRFIRAAGDPASGDEVLLDLGDAVGEAAHSAQSAHRRLTTRVLDTVAAARRREVADALDRVDMQLLRETDPEAYRRAAG
jgi:hypothetical protein